MNGIDKDIVLLASLASRDIRSELLPLIKEEYQHLSLAAQAFSKLLFPLLEKIPPEEDLDPWSVAQLAGDLTDRERKSLEELIRSFLQLKDSSIKAYLESVYARIRKRRLALSLENIVARDHIITDEDLDKVLTDLQKLVQLRLHRLKPRKASDIDPTRLLKEELGEMNGLPSHFHPFNEKLSLGGYLPGELVVVAAAPSRGKSMWMINEAIHAASLGYRVLYIALGDMMFTDLIARLLAVWHTREAWIKDPAILLHYQEEPQSFFQHPFYQAYSTKSILENFEKLHKEAKPILDNIYLEVDAPGKITVEDIRKTIQSIPEHIHMVIVDYDSNLRAYSDALYERGNEVYEALAGLARPKNELPRVVLVGSQIKPEFWSLEEVPLQALAESSRKQAVADLIITIGRNLQDLNYHQGKVSIVKNRRGPVASEGYFLFPTGVFYPKKIILNEFINQLRDQTRSQLKTNVDSAIAENLN
jgi:replicative DNA helicase